MRWGRSVLYIEYHHRQDEVRKRVDGFVFYCRACHEACENQKQLHRRVPWAILKSTCLHYQGQEQAYRHLNQDRNFLLITSEWEERGGAIYENRQHSAMLKRLPDQRGTKSSRSARHQQNNKGYLGAKVSFFPFRPP